MNRADKNKLTKAGFATPRGGAKGAYQNHVLRSNKVIIPFERFDVESASSYQDGYVVRLLPEQYFESTGQPYSRFLEPDSEIRVGGNAFVLYRTYEIFQRFPPLPGWEVRGLVTPDGTPATARGRGIQDTGHYVVRISTSSPDRPTRNEGPPQGIFAPEYAPEEMNFLSQCVLAWLTVHTFGSPYTTHQARHLRAILASEHLLNDHVWEFNGVMRHGVTVCPLYSRFIRYGELHSMLNLTDEQSLANAALQVEGATRSTIVNLFHLHPLKYGEVEHTPQNVAWGHSVCNTKLGQRRCYPLQELQKEGQIVGTISEEGVDTFGWISQDWEMIRSPTGSVWIRLCGDADDLIHSRTEPIALEEPPPLGSSGASSEEDLTQEA